MHFYDDQNYNIYIYMNLLTNNIIKFINKNNYNIQKKKKKKHHIINGLIIYI